MKDNISKYLKADPTGWLMEESEPSISYLVTRDLHDNPDEMLYENLLGSDEIMRLTSTTEGFLGDAINFDIFYTGTMWCFAEAIERGMDIRTPILRNTADFLVQKVQTESGGFSLNWKPQTPVACRTGDMVRSLLRSGFRDPAVDKGIDWIVTHQRHDGGWLHCPISGTCDQMRLLFLNSPGKGLERENDNRVTSCFYATIACAMALVENRDRGGTANDNVIRNAAEFFLRRSLFRDSKNNPIRPRKSWNRDFRNLGYPVMCQYDILYGLLFIARSGFLRDGRTNEAFNLIISKQNDDGTWNTENDGIGTIEGGKKRRHRGKKSKWITLQALRLLRYATFLPSR